MSSLTAWVKRADWWLHDADLAGQPLWLRAPLSVARLGAALVREVTEGQLTLRAMSLVYTTLLSMVPFLALAFSVLKGFGAHNAIEPFLAGLFEPLGEQGAELSTLVIGFVDNMRVGVLGFVGLAFLVYTVIALVQKIEAAFNASWRIRTQRNLAQRFSNYLSVILIGPLLVVSALGITASVMSSTLMQQLIAVEPFGELILVASRLVPYLLIITAFTFVYIFVPNTRVRLGPALIGGVVAGLLWQSAGWVFASMVAGSGNYAAIYSSFAVVILLLIWIYVAWLILLVGASVAFYVQHPEYLRLRGRELRLSAASVERIGLATLGEIGRRFLTGEPAPSARDLSARLGLPGEAIEDALARLVRAELVLRIENDTEPRFAPARDLAAIKLDEVVEALRSDRDDALAQTVRLAGALAGVADDLDRRRREALVGQSLRDVLEAQR